MRKKGSPTYLGKGQPPKKDNSAAAQIRLIASILIFVTAFAVRFIFPEFSAGIRESILSILNANVDYMAAAEAFSDGISGRRDIKSTAVTVFTYLTVPDAEAVFAQEIDFPIENIGVLSHRQPAAVTEPTEPEEKEDEMLTLMVSAFKEKQSKFEGHDMPANVTYDAPKLGIDYVRPAEGTFTSAFGYRDHPVDGNIKFHYGLDIGCSLGSEIKCFGDGTVTEVTDSSSYGLNIVVTHANGVTTRYAHCSEILKKVGDTVKCGDVIAKSGQTGNATGPCMHFEIRVNDTYVNPEYYLYGL